MPPPPKKSTITTPALSLIEQAANQSALQLKADAPGGAVKLRLSVSKESAGLAQKIAVVLLIIGAGTVNVKMSPTVGVPEQLVSTLTDAAARGRDEKRAEAAMRQIFVNIG